MSIIGTDGILLQTSILRSHVGRLIAVILSVWGEDIPDLFSRPKPPRRAFSETRKDRRPSFAIPFQELLAMGVTFVCFGSITSSPDSVQSFLAWVAALQDRVNYVVFKNLKDGDYLPDYEQTVEAAQFRSLFSPHHVVIPRLDEEYQTELERLNLTIAEVLDSADGISARGHDLGPILSRLLVRARLRNYQRGIYEQFDPIRSLLLPEHQIQGKEVTHA